jgi:hypothetical protein
VGFHTLATGVFQSGGIEPLPIRQPFGMSHRVSWYLVWTHLSYLRPVVCRNMSLHIDKSSQR